MKKKLMQDVENFIYEYYKQKSPPENVYHNLRHAQDVVERVKDIGKASGVSDQDLDILINAAWFHDVGYLETDKNHEETSVNIAKEYLIKNNYLKKHIDRVCDCIMATKMPHKPTNLFEEIICDADISHIGSKNFFDQTELLKLEIEKREQRKISDIEWIEKNLEFLTTNKFFTKSAKKKYDKRKNKNLIELEKRHQKELNKKAKQKTDEEKIIIDQKKIALKTADSKKSDRGIETMFRNVMRTHVSFSSMADGKASIMISVNTLILGAIFTILAGKLDSNPHLIIPTIVLTIVSLVTLVISILVTRPSISSGVFTKEDIEKKNTNLLFFGNFHKMDLSNFTWGMTEMMEDKDYLYGSMIKDFYFLGQVLGKKYEFLKLCYTFFMYGIILSVIIFAIFTWMNQNQLI